MKNQMNIWESGHLDPRHASLLIEDLLDDLEREHAFHWLLHRMDEDREQGKNLLQVYQTDLFSVYVDYDAQTVFVSAVLGCHPPDETFELIDFYNTIKENAPVFEPDGGESTQYGAGFKLHVYKKKMP